VTFVSRYTILYSPPPSLDGVKVLMCSPVLYHHVLALLSSPGTSRRFGRSITIPVGNRPRKQRDNAQGRSPAFAAWTCGPSPSTTTVFSGLAAGPTSGVLSGFHHATNSFRFGLERNWYCLLVTGSSLAFECFVLLCIRPLLCLDRNPYGLLCIYFLTAAIFTSVPHRHPTSDLSSLV
jgi:hypothetical protein